METSPKRTSQVGEGELTYSQGDFLANLFPLQESEKEQRMIATSGQKCLEQYKRLSRHGSWAKMFSELLVGMEGWYSSKCRLTWKLKGTKYNRMFFQLVPLTHRTEETGCGLLLKTPCKMDGEVTSGKANPISGNSGTLAQEIMSGYKPTMEKLGLLPTPRACESIERRNMKTIVDKVENGGDVTLTTLARYKDGMLLPTPATRDWKGARSTEALEESGRNQTNSLPDAFGQPGKSSQLSPLFVTEMMGYPIEYLVLPFLNGETNQ